jgi:hypothetical protein
MTTELLDTAGERLSVECALPWVADLVREGCGSELRQGDIESPSVSIRVEAEGREFDTRGWPLLTRGAWHRDGDVVVENVCTAGFDLHLSCTPDAADFTFRWRPPTRDRVAARVLRSRFHLLARAVLIQYPALWRAGWSGRAPLHASAYDTGRVCPLLTAPSGVGRSTLLLEELQSGARATSDNLAVGDGSTIWGLVEPLRVNGGGGRRMPHGRSEIALRDRAESLAPTSLVVLARGDGDAPVLAPCSKEAATRSLVTSTYMAGELRRYWSFASTLAAGTGLGPAHPPVTAVAEGFSRSLRCFTLHLGRVPGAGLSDVIDELRSAA